MQISHQFNMKQSRILVTVLVVIMLVTAMVGLRHIKSLDNQIEFKKIQLKDNSVQIKLLDKKYDDLEQELQKKDSDKANIEQQLKDLQKERDTLSKQLQAKVEQKQRDIAAKAAEAAKQAVRTPKAYAATGSCAELGAKMSRLGVTGAELSAALTLATRESSCRSSAVNASSGACGEFQSYPCGKWGTPGTDPYLQNAISYARGRYGGFVAALNHSYANNWY